MDISLAPDQPLPYVYVDDPLIIELNADEDAEARIHLTVEASHDGTRTEVDLPPVLLRAHGSRWCPVKGLPKERGYYTIGIRVETDAAVFEKSLAFCRIDRPAKTAPPLYAHVDDLKPGTLLALNTVSVNALRFDVNEENLTMHLDEAIARGFHPILYLEEGGPQSTTAAVEQLAGRYKDKILRWDLSPGDRASWLSPTIETIRNTGSDAPVYAVAANVDTLNSILQIGMGSVLKGTLVPHHLSANDIMALQHCARGFGQENSEFLLYDDQGAAGWLQRFFEQRSTGILQTGFPVTRLYNEALGEPLVALSALSHRLFPMTFVGTISPAQDLETSTQKALLFRNGASWFLVFWDTSTDTELLLEAGDARDLLLTDALNNTLILPDISQTALPLVARTMPQYLTGVDGALLGQAARSRAQIEIQRLLAEPRFQYYLPNASQTVMELTGDGQQSTTRKNFYNLLRQLPKLEARWHAGLIPQTVAVPAIARLATLSRALCTVENSSGKSFLEPLGDTLTRCEEFQSLYLTGSIKTPEAYQRGDWLLNEVRRLMDEAQNLAAAGRKIEAGAVAALAEWRARSLEEAAKAGPKSSAMNDTMEADLAAAREAQAVESADGDDK
jgi:hypothetical protein